MKCHFFRGVGKARIMFVDLKKGQKRNRLAWLDTAGICDLDPAVVVDRLDGHDLDPMYLDPVDLDLVDLDPVDHAGDRAREVEADDQDPVAKSG